MALPVEFLELLEHPAPGLYFPPHKYAGTPGRILSASHHANLPMDAELAAAMFGRMFPQLPETADQFAQLYGLCDGAALCRILPEGHKAEIASQSDLGGSETQLMLSPFGEWREMTRELATGGSAFIIEGFEETFPEGRFVVIGGGSSEGTRLVLSLEGKFVGKPTAGKILYASMDPVLAVGEPIADNLYDLLTQFSADPAAFLRRIGQTYYITTSKGTWGDVPERYLPDIHDAGILKTPGS